MAKLYILGICNSIVLKWFLIEIAELYECNNPIREIKYDRQIDEFCIEFRDREYAYNVFQKLIEKTDEAQADYRLELASYY